MTEQKKKHFNNVENQTKKKQLQKTINIQLQNHLASCSLKGRYKSQKIHVHIYLLQILNRFQHERLLLAVNCRIGVEEITLKGSRFHHCGA